MTARTHDLAAFTALGVIVISSAGLLFSLSTAIVSVLANLIGGITPDIDQPTAPFWRNLPVGRYLGKVFGLLSGGHRFLTHSIFGLIVFGFLAHSLLRILHPIMSNVNTGYVWWAYTIGMTSHLVMDTFTKEGVPWLLPIPIKVGLPPMKSMRTTTGKAVETLVIFPTLIVFNLAFYWSHYDQVLAVLHQLH